MEKPESILSVQYKWNPECQQPRIQKPVSVGQTPTNLNPDKYCDPLGDMNVIGFFKDVPENHTLEEKSIVMAVARVRFYVLVSSPL